MNYKERSRKFYYETIYDSNTIIFLKELEFFTHIIGYNTNEIKGIISFENPRYLKSIKKILFIDNVVNCDKNDREKLVYVESMDCVWDSITPNCDTFSLSKSISNNDETDIISINNLLSKINSQKNCSTHIVGIVMNNPNLVKKLCLKIVKLEEENSELSKQNMQLVNKLLSSETTVTTHNEDSSNKLTNKMNKSNNNNKSTNINKSNNNANNRITNINVFLNNECKDAITLSDFINKIQVTNHDIEMLTQEGYEKSTANMIKRELGNYDIKSRPIHCTDVKREVMHIKNDEGWIKEKGRESKDVRSAISKISKNQIKKLFEYYNDGNSAIGTRLFEEKIAAMKQINDGATDPDTANRKILQNLFEFIRIDLDMMEMEQEYGQNSHTNTE